MVKHIVVLLLSILPAYFVNGNSLLEAISKVGPKGQGNQEVIDNWKQIKSMSSSNIIELFELMNRCNQLGENWIRAAIFEILERSGSNSLPQDGTINFIKNLNNKGSARRCAFDFLKRFTPQISQSMRSSFIDDPEPSLRREGVELLLQQAEVLQNAEQSIEAYEYALGKARDVDQIEQACQSLESLGQKIDLPKIMGFITEWKVIGPFDNSDRRGFGVGFPPEKNNIELEKEYEGKNGGVKWQKFSTSDRLGLLDLNQPFGHIKEVLCYAHTEFESSVEQSVQFRIGSKNAWKLWVNDKLIFARDEYHRGSTRVDQFILDGQLRKGTNKILVKICQNEQTESWTKQWEFCFRITDLTGTPIAE